jgi:PAS domain S-box-containing protein
LNTVIVGGGAGCEAILRMMHEDRIGHLEMKIVGVADPDPKAPGLRFAESIGVPVLLSDHRQLLEQPNIDLIIELTGSDAIRDELERLRPDHVKLIDHFSARFFWDLRQAHEEADRQRDRARAAVDAERQRIDQIFDSIPDEIVVLDADLAIQRANASFLRNNNLDLATIQNRHCYEVEQRVRGECEISVQGCACANVLQTGAPCSLVRKHYDDEGTARYAAIVAAPIVDSAGEVTGLIEMTRDITHRIRLEEELKATEVQLQRLMDTAPLAVCVKSRSGRFIEVNPAACGLFAKPRSKIVGRTAHEILPREAAEALSQGDRAILTGARQLTYATEVTLDGEKVFLNTTKFPVLNADEEVTAIAELSQDITAQKEAEAELIQTREYLQYILDNAPVMVITTDLDGHIVSCNSAAVATLGYGPEHLTGRHVQTLYRDPEDREKLIRRVDQEGPIHDHEAVLIHADGHEVTVSVSLSLLKNARGQLLGKIMLGRDLSHRKALMDQIIQSERLAAVGRLAAGVAHEINNPLAVIAEVAGYLQDLVDCAQQNSSSALRSELESGLPKILHNVSRGRSITSRLLSFARKSELQSEEADLGASLEEVLPLLEKRARLAQVTIHHQVPPDTPMIAIEELQLEEIVINLIMNAIQAMAGRGEGNIWLDAETTGERVVITIRDDGPGIVDEVRDRLFDPFVSTKPMGEGTGLGLSICYGIVKRNDGEIRVESKPAEGACFQVILPVCRTRPARGT